MNKNRVLISNISKDIGLRLPTSGYIDNSRILNYEVHDNRLNLKASFKKYDDRVYNVWYNEDNFRFYGMKNLTIYDINIDNNSFLINEMMDKNGESYIKKIRFENYKDRNSFSVEKVYLDNPDKNEYIGITNDNKETKLSINDEDHTVTTSNNKKFKKIFKSVLEIERNDIKDSFDLIHSSIPTFFDSIKYDFNILKIFNELYDNNELNVKHIIDSVVYKK